jgi:integrase
MHGLPRLMAALIYGTGMRLTECTQIRVRDGKGEKDRVVPLRVRIKPELLAGIRETERLHWRDLANGAGAVKLPGAPARKYRSAPREWACQ